MITKASAVFRDIRESLSVNPALMRLVTFGFWFVTVVNLMACGWILMGASEVQRPAADQYIRALYWCVTTIATIGNVANLIANPDVARGNYQTKMEVVVNGVRVATLGQGSPFGETALIQGERRNAGIRALSYCDVYKLSKTDLDALRGRYPDFDEQMRKVAESRLRDTEEKTRK